VKKVVKKIADGIDLGKVGDFDYGWFAAGLAIGKRL
jgi:hypothetical protein